MSGEAGWWDDYFDERFVEIYAPLLPEERTRAEVAGAIELLGLPVGARILDLGCGWGRHAVGLARAGYRVTGLDLSAALLEHARRAARRARVRVDWVRADARELGFDAEFDAVVSLFSSLGYFPDEADDLRVLQGVRAALKPGGDFLLETMHRDRVVRDYAERDWWEGPGGEIVRVEREFDAVAGLSRERLHWRRGAEEGEKYHEIRVRSASEWARLLAAAGLEPAGWYGGWEGEAFTADAEQLIVRARRGG